MLRGTLMPRRYGVTTDWQACLAQNRVMLASECADRAAQTHWSAGKERLLAVGVGIRMVQDRHARNS